jgi:hypothetical protein
MIEVIEKYIKPIGKYLDFIFFGDDLGLQLAPMISSQLFRRFELISKFRILGV